MKQFLQKLLGASLILFLAVVLALPMAAATTLLSAVTTTGAGTSYATKTTGSLFAHVYSAAGASAVVVIQQSVNGSIWNTVATITNPDATGELWHGPAAPFTRANVTSRSSGTLTAVLDYSPSTQVTQWALVNASTTTSAAKSGLVKYTWTNAELVAGGTGGTSYNLPVGTLPANSFVKRAYIVLGTQATFAAGTLTMSLGVTGTAYTDWLAAGSLKGSAGAVYGDAAAEQGTDLGALFYATSKSIYAQVLAGAGDLANVTTSTGTIYVVYETLP